MCWLCVIQIENKLTTCEVVNLIYHFDCNRILNNTRSREAIHRGNDDRQRRSVDPGTAELVFDPTPELVLR